MPLVADNARQLAAALVVFSALVAALVLGRAVLMPLALAVLVSFILAPIVRRLTRWGLPNGLAVGAALTAAIAMFLAVTIIFSAQVLTVTASLENYKANIVAKARAVATLSRDDGVITRAVNAIDKLGYEIGREIQRGQPATTGADGAIVVRTEETDVARASRSIAGNGVSV